MAIASTTERLGSMDIAMSSNNERLGRTETAISNNIERLGAVETAVANTNERLGHMMITVAGLENRMTDVLGQMQDTMRRVGLVEEGIAMLTRERQGERDALDALAQRMQALEASVARLSGWERHGWQWRQ